MPGMEKVTHTTAEAVCGLLAARIECERGTLPGGIDEGFGSVVVSELDEAIKAGVRALALSKAIVNEGTGKHHAVVHQFPTVRRAEAA